MPCDTAFYAPALWARVRDDYLAGESADAVCARHGVSRSQLFAQARAGGWRRSDQASGAPAPEAEVDDGAPAPPTAELAGEALRLGARALARGRLHEAQGWIALAARLRALAMDERDRYAWGGVLKADAAAAGAAPARPSTPRTPGVPPAAPAPVAAPTRDPDAPSPAASDLALAVGRLAREGAALCARRDAGDDVDADALALHAELAALEAAAAGPMRPPGADAGAYWEWRAGPDGPAGLPAGAAAPTSGGARAPPATAR